MKVAINGFGRIGRAFFKLALSESDISVEAVNDLADLENLAYLLKNDTVYGRFAGKIETAAGKLKIDGKEILFLQEKDPARLPWRDLGIDVAVEATGVFSDYNRARAHLDAGAKKVIITAPAKGKEGEEGRTILLGVNDADAEKFDVISDGSCTTNAVAPIMEVLREKIGVRKAVLNTIHAYTATQGLVDGGNSRDWRRGRAAAQNIVPSSTGAAQCVGKVIADLEGKFDGIALRVPVACGSIADITFVAGRETAIEEVNQILRDATQEEKWQGIIGVADEALVSSDIIKTTTPAIADLSFTKVVDKDLVKVLIWYDNEWAYSWTLLQQIKKISSLLK